MAGGEEFLFIKDFQLINSEGMRALENHHSATPNGTRDTGNLDPWKDFTSKWEAHMEFHDGWVGLTIPESITLLNLNTRETTQTVHASLKINAIDCLPPRKSFCPSPDQKKKLRLNLTSRLVLLNRTFCNHWSILCLYHSKVSCQALVTIGHLKCG